MNAHRFYHLYILLFLAALNPAVAYVDLPSCSASPPAKTIEVPLGESMNLSYPKPLRVGSFLNSPFRHQSTFACDSGQGGKSMPGPFDTYVCKDGDHFLIAAPPGADPRGRPNYYVMTCIKK